MNTTQNKPHQQIKQRKDTTINRSARLPNAARAGLAAIGLALLIGGWSHFAAAQDAPMTETDRKRAEQQKPDYSPYPDQHFPNRVFWGTAHNHTK